MRKYYNKLIRDNIPEIIANDNGKRASVKVLTDDECLKYLNQKLSEELNEYLASSEIEELADLQEVIYGICCNFQSFILGKTIYTRGD